MEHTRFVGLDIHKERISIAVAESGRSCAGNISVRFPTIPLRSVSCATVSSVRAKTLAFCYEAGPCGYGFRDAPGRSMGGVVL